MHREDFVLGTRITPPRPIKRTLRRERVTARLTRALDYRLTVLHAGAGYGKSTALAEFSQDPLSLAWYQLVPEDSDPYGFLVYLLNAFYRALETLTPRQLAILEAWDGTAQALPWKAVIDTLVNDLLEVQGPVVLVVDDAHLLNDAPASRAILDRLVRYAPPALHVVISTRYPLRLDSLPALRVKGEVLEIGQEELVFSQTEIISLYRDHYNLDLSDEKAAILVRETGGWAIAIQLVGQGIAKGDSAHFPRVLEGLEGLRDDLFAYLAREVLLAQSEEIQDFLRVTAPMRQMTPALCDCLRGADDSARLLTELSEMGLFVMELEHGRTSYHPLFREFLVRQLEPSRLREIHHRAVTCHAEELDEAIYHALQAGEHDAAARLIAEQGRGKVRAGLLETLGDWISSLTPDALLNHPILFVFQGDIARLHSRFEEALRWYQEAEDRFRRLGDPVGIGQALRGQARIYLDTVNPSKAEHLLQEALRLADGQEDREARADLLELLAENQLNRGQSDEASRLRGEANALREEGPGNAELDVRVMLRTGRLEDARLELERRAEAEQGAPIMQPRAHRETLLLLSFILACQGDAETAFAAAVEGTRRGEALDSPFITAVGHMRQGHAILLRDGEGIFAEAQACFERAIAISNTLEVNRLKVEAYWGLCRVEGYQGHIERAHQVASLGLEIASEAGDEWITAGIAVSLGAAHLLTDQPADAADWFRRAYLGFVECADTYGQALTRLWQCLLWLAVNDLDRLDHALSALLTLTETHSYDFLFTRRVMAGPPRPRRFVPLLLRARDSADHAAYASHLLTGLGLADLKFDPGYQLQVQTLGTFRAWRGTEEIDPGDWQREKARQLFLLLLTAHGTLLDKARIADTLWPDLNTESADQNFRVALNSLYRALEPGRQSGAPSSYITRDGSLYGLRPEADLWWDAREFEGLIQRGDALLESDQEGAMDAYRRALTLYQGDYLEELVYEESWWMDRRERLRNLYLRGADRLAQLLVEREAWEDVLEVCQAIIACDDWWERAYRLMMVAYAALGNRPQALKVYQKLATRLEADLDTVPSPETTSLYEQLSQGVD